MASHRSLMVAAALLAAGVALSGCALIRGSEYPAQDITFIVPFAPGGNSDMISRILTQEGEQLLKRKLIIVNKPGGSATIGIAEIAQAKPDGYTIGLGTTSAAALQLHLSKLPYGGPDTYQPIVKVIEQSALLAVRSDAPWKTLDEFLADAKKRPGAIRVATSGSTSIDAFMLHQFASVAGVELTAVPFSGGGGEAMTAFLGGHVEANASYVPNVRQYVESGQARVLAIFKDRTPVFPEVPSALDFGYKVTAPGTLYFVMGPKGMDKGVVDKLNAAFTTVLKGETFQKFARDNGMSVDPVGPTELAKQISEIIDTYGKLVKDMKLEVKK